uniref:Uncharacterized protein n=1 Tax=Setaria viridis TaxID=4556 RepID=A0A4U6T725_SETVI|nr:hypothetical protein SEVIR_9G505850v2 [Setaria viridis]
MDPNLLLPSLTSLRPTPPTSSSALPAATAPLPRPRRRRGPPSLHRLLLLLPSHFAPVVELISGGVRFKKPLPPPPPPSRPPPHQLATAARPRPSTAQRGSTATPAGGAAAAHLVAVSTTSPARYPAALKLPLGLPETGNPQTPEP